MSLQVKKSTFFVLDFGFDIFNSVRGLHLKGDGFTRQSFDKNLHRCSLKRKSNMCQSDWGGPANVDITMNGNLNSSMLLTLVPVIYFVIRVNYQDTFNCYTTCF